jgi:hypothetical protein
MKKSLVVVMLLVLGAVAMGSPVGAVTPTGFVGDDVAARAYNSFTQVWVPILALAALLGIIFALIGGYAHLTKKVVLSIIAIILLGGGLPLLQAYSGGTIAQSLLLP